MAAERVRSLVKRNFDVCKSESPVWRRGGAENLDRVVGKRNGKDRERAESTEYGELSSAFLAGPRKVALNRVRLRSDKRPRTRDISMYVSFVSEPVLPIP